ncbi:single-minded homolog 2 isoform X2 [Chironomus tepperi]|uniref:single-minded homolog 2 isoform X2 n=1 Tax=Chironomus tepperi TaxID=113505 RepID=UPI00391F7E67
MKKMFSRFETNKSTKGASKLRRDLINSEIANLRDLLPLPQSTRQRLSQLQLMALVCVYVRKANYFQQVFKRYDNGLQNITPNIGFSKALSGFLMMLTQNGKLLYISDNAAEYLGHSMEDLLIHGDSVYDIIDKQDYNAIQSELNRSGSHIHQSTSLHNLHHHHHHHSANMDGEKRIFLCRMNVSRNARRQMRFGDQKVVLIQGHYLSFLPLCSRNEPVFLATCTPIAMPETRECVVQGATNVFTTIHSMDMKFIHIDKNGEFHLGYTKEELNGSSWYQLIHWEYIKEAQMKHRLITQSEQDRSCIVLTRLQNKTGDFIWIHLVLQVRDSQDSNQHSVIVCTNQVLSDKEASVMLSNSWLYHYYSVQSKIQMGLTYEGSRLPQITSTNYYPYQPINPQHYPMHQIHQTAAYDAQGHPTHIQHGHPYEHYSPPVSNINHHNDINHNSPTLKETTATSAALVPVDYSQQHSMEKLSPASSVVVATAHENGNRENKIEDYSEPSRKKQADDKSNKLQNHDKKLSKVDYKSVRISNKKYTFKRIESLQISDSTTIETEEIQVPRAAHTYDNHVISNNNNNNSNDNNHHIVMEVEHRDGQMLYLNSSIHTARSRISKSFSSCLPLLPPHVESSVAPGAEIEQWNPSPTWSSHENTIQKVPDIVHQQLSPYLITTPPTPMSASYIPHTSSFTFDWTPEHYVPTVGTMHEERNIMELAPARCYYNRPQLMNIDDNNHHHHHHKDETIVRNS